MTHFKRRQVLRWLAAMSGSATALAITTSCAPNAKQTAATILPTSDAAIASQQDVADTFTQAGVLKAKVDVKPLWDFSFNGAISQCQ